MRDMGDQMLLYDDSYWDAYSISRQYCCCYSSFHVETHLWINVKKKHMK